MPGFDSDLSGSCASRRTLCLRKNSEIKISANFNSRMPAMAFATA